MSSTIARIKESFTRRTGRVASSQQTKTSQIQQSTDPTPSSPRGPLIRIHEPNALSAQQDPTDTADQFHSVPSGHSKNLPPLSLAAIVAVERAAAAQRGSKVAAQITDSGRPRNESDLGPIVSTDLPFAPCNSARTEIRPDVDGSKQTYIHGLSMPVNAGSVEATLSEVATKLHGEHPAIGHTTAPTVATALQHQQTTMAQLDGGEHVSHVAAPAALPQFYVHTTQSAQICRICQNPAQNPVDLVPCKHGLYCYACLSMNLSHVPAGPRNSFSPQQPRLCPHCRREVEELRFMSTNRVIEIPTIRTEGPSSATARSSSVPARVNRNPALPPEEIQPDPRCEHSERARPSSYVVTPGPCWQIIKRTIVRAGREYFHERPATRRRVKWLRGAVVEEKSSASLHKIPSGTSSESFRVRKSYPPSDAAIGQNRDEIDLAHGETIGDNIEQPPRTCLQHVGDQGLTRSSEVLHMGQSGTQELDSRRTAVRTNGLLSEKFRSWFRGRFSRHRTASQEQPRQPIVEQQD